MNNKTRNFTAGGAISKYRIVKFSADSTIVQAAAATDLLLGVATDLDIASGKRGDAIVEGFAQVEFGGVVARGAFVTADADGKAVACAPTAGNKAQSIGIAMFTAASGDIGEILVCRSQVTTPA